jgi:hypothetical protein
VYNSLASGDNMNILAVLSEEHVPRNYEQGEKVIK